jgi:hypothetical protein
MTGRSHLSPHILAPFVGSSEPASPGRRPIGLSLSRSSPIVCTEHPARKTGIGSRVAVREVELPDSARCTIR